MFERNGQVVPEDMIERSFEDGVNGRVRAVTRIARTCLKREHLSRTATITIVVGSWLTLFNQGDTIAAVGVDVLLAAKVGLNYLTPFVVANLGLLSRKRAVGDGDRPR